MRLRGPQLKEKRAFEDKGIAMLGNTETIEQTFQCVLGQEKPKVLKAIALIRTITQKYPQVHPIPAHDVSAFRSIPVFPASTR
jgi:hypothetical protein